MISWLSILIIERNYKCNLFCIRININNVFSFAIIVHIYSFSYILPRARHLNIILSLKSYRLKTIFILTTIYYKSLSVLRTRNRMEDLGDSCCVRHLKYNIHVTYVQRGSMRRQNDRAMWDETKKDRRDISGCSGEIISARFSTEI